MPLLAAMIMLSNLSPSLKPNQLRVNALTHPLAIVNLQPEFSWMLIGVNPNARDLHQAAYRIQVASNRAKLDSGDDLWDSGWVSSTDSFGIAYRGQSLASGSSYVWSVSVRDPEGAVSPAEISTFATGLQAMSDWKGAWIHDPKLVGDQNPFPTAKWIWQRAEGRTGVASESFSFRKTFNLSDASQWKDANFSLTVDDSFEVTFNGVSIGKSYGQVDEWHHVREFDLAKLLKSGQNELVVHATNSAGPAGVLGSLHLISSSGETLNIGTDETWRVSPGGSAAVVLGENGIDPWGKVLPVSHAPATYYRSQFGVEKAVLRATAYVTALGLVDLHLNGRRVSEDLFTPGWTDYDKRVCYKAYDVSKWIKSGENAIGAIVGDGWYSGYLGYSHTRAHYGPYPHLRIQLAIEYTDGTQDVIVTADHWRATTGATTDQDFLQGESYDRQLELNGWDLAGYDDSAWRRAQISSDVKIPIEPFTGVPVLPYDRLDFVSSKEIEPGVYVLDFGQNLAGFAHLKLAGKRGQTIRMRFAEVLNPDGSMYVTNLRSARATDSYTFGSSKVEEWSPRFTFHGFRYVEVSGVGRAPKKGEFQAVAISSATPEAGHFNSGDATLNQIAHNAWWTQKMNFIDIPTDCPQRDERLGWTGDAQAYIQTAAYYSDVQAFFTKWLVALDDAQREDGQFPMVAPLRVAGGDGGPAWADAGVICPWTIYKMYGDRTLLARHYPAMKRFVDFCEKRGKPNLMPPDSFHCFGDWLSINANTPNEVIYMAYFAYSAHLVALSAAELGHQEDAKHYHELFERVKAAFNTAFVESDGKIKGHTQCGYVLAIACDLLDPLKEEQAAQHLVADIKARGDHLSTGFVGTKDLMWALSKVGRNDVALTLLHQKTFPSWGFEVANGATTIWERWDGWTPERGFQDPGMNSFAHYAYGAVMGWVYAKIGGIESLEPGFGRIRVAPVIDSKLGFVECRYASVRGEIRSDWKLSGDLLTMQVTIPANTRAEIVVPKRSKGLVSGSHLEDGSARGDSVVFEVGSGSYTFASE